MKKRLAIALAAILVVGTIFTGCAGNQQAPAPQQGQAEEIVSVAEIDYANIGFDYAADIAEQIAATPIVPSQEGLLVTAADANGADGVALVTVPALESENDYFFNAMVAGNAVTLTGDIKTATSSASGELTVADGAVTFVPATLNAKNMTDEVIAIELNDGTMVNVHTLNPLMATMEVLGDGVAPENAGVYSLALDKFLTRISTEGDILYFRQVNTVGELMVENFQTQITNDGIFYTFFVELNAQFRNANGGYSSGMYVVMDENFKQCDVVTLLPNAEENHTHGEGYLDQHEFVVMGAGHYLTLSYTLLDVTNIPAEVPSRDGEGYVWAGIMQEVKDGVVLKEINTADYPLLYVSAVEKLDYANSTLEGVVVTVGQNEVPSFADGIMDYVHVNSMDYTLNPDGTADKLLVSMRDQSAVYQFDFDTAAVEWILGGKASTLTVPEELTTDREDEAANAFKAFTFGQHYARYINKAADGTIAGNPVISIFDNQTGMGPFIRVVPVPTNTRVLRGTVDAAAGTFTVDNVIVGQQLDALTGLYHNASHCGSVEYYNADSVVIGWGLHGVIDNIGAFAPQGTISDMGFEDLRIGSRPVVGEYSEDGTSVKFELKASRSALVQSHEGFFSYRTYKTVK